MTNMLSFKLDFLLLFLLSSLIVADTDIVKKNIPKEDKDDYYKYTIENFPVHWSQYWIESKSATEVPAGATNVTLNLPFSFPFYAHPVDRIVIYSSGYISTADLKDEQKSKYIAPLLANLDPHHDPTSGLSYWIDKRNSSVTVEWKNAIVKDLPTRVPFTFRAKIWSNGLIEFSYDYLGLNLAQMLPYDKDFRIGIGDSVKSFGHVFKYHSISIPRDMLQDKSKVTLRPLPTCATLQFCDECVQSNPDFHCFWCPVIQKCLSGMDFHRPEYQNEFCPKAESKSVCNERPGNFSIFPKIKDSLKTSTPPTTTNDDSTYSQTVSTPTTTTNSTMSSETTKPDESATTSTQGTTTEVIELNSITEKPVPFEQHFLYYNVTLVKDEISAKKLWVDMTDKTSGRVRTSAASVSRVQAHQLKLPFPFPFFGNMKTQLSLTSDGFISTMNSWMIHDKTHFIAPLKGILNHPIKAFTTSVNFKVSSRSVTVQWETRRYQSMLQTNFSPFTFQATLHSDGDIDFVYKDLGHLKNSQNEFIGLSEGHSEDLKLGLLLYRSEPIKYKEQHSVNLTDMKQHLSNWTAIKFTALPTCSSQKTCSDCLSMPGLSGFQCGWCSAGKICRSNKEPPGEEWVVHNCYMNMIHEEEQCPVEKAKHLTHEDFEDLAPEDHKYYTSTFFGKESWEEHFVDFTEVNATDLWKTSNNFLNADPYTLSFLFPFYGHPIKDIMILSGGFISLASTFSERTILEHEYIAPLMADLDASYSKDAKIQIYETDDSATIHWSNMRLVSRPGMDPFSFQLTLKSDGRIIFSYEEIPIDSVSKIVSSDLNILHPIRIGISDSFLYNAKKAFTSRTATKLYKYHDLDLRSHADHIQSYTGIILDPLPTCNSFSSCSSCLRSDPNLNCVWCPGLSFCSDGMDRKRQEWDATRCFVSNIGLRKVNECPLEVKAVSEQYYSNIMYHQKDSLWENTSSLNIHMRPVLDPSYFQIDLFDPLTFFEEEVTSLTISSGGVVGVSHDEQKKGNSSKPVAYKYMAPFKSSLFFKNEGHIAHGNVKIDGEKCFGVEWREAYFSKKGSLTLHLAVCKNGSIYFHYTNVTKDPYVSFDDLDVSIGLWHGMVKNEFINMASDEVQIKSIESLSGLVIKFSPLTSCSLSPSCASSPDCPRYSAMHECSRIPCREPFNDDLICDKLEAIVEKIVQPESHSNGIAIAGVIGGVLLIALLVGVLAFGIKKLDGRPGKWQTFHSIFQPGYQIFRSGAEIGSQEVLDEGFRRNVDENFL